MVLVGDLLGKAGSQLLCCRLEYRHKAVTVYPLEVTKRAVHHDDELVYSRVSEPVKFDMIPPPFSPFGISKLNRDAVSFVCANLESANILPLDPRTVGVTAQPKSLSWFVAPL